MIDTSDIRLGKIGPDPEATDSRLAECRFAKMIPDRTDAEDGSAAGGAGQATRQTQDENPAIPRGCQWTQAFNA